MSSSKEIIRAFGYFYYIRGSFLADKNLINVLRGVIPDFVEANSEISPLFLYEKFRGGNFLRLVCIQFLCALKLQLGSHPNLPKNGMSEFYHNLSLQVLTKSNNEILLDFTSTSDLVMNIRHLLQSKTYGFKKTDQEAKKIKTNKKFFKEIVLLENTLRRKMF